MDRQTRKANLKKLQQPAITKLRSTRSTKAAAATMTLSEYFATPEKLRNNAAPEILEPRLQQADNDDLFVEPECKKTRACRDTEHTVKDIPKKAPKLKASSSQRRGGRTGGRGKSKKQPSISEFLRNEQLFSEVTAQHCMADNFSPDDIEMALALSKSVAEKQGALRLQDTADEEDEVVNLLNKSDTEATENIRRKLQKYGFRTAAKEDYNWMALATLPSVNGKRGKRCKWANKFTPLTLRNPEEQLKKVECKVKAFMAQQVRTKLPSAAALLLPPIQLVSEQLQQLEANAKCRITREPSEGCIENLSAYYVQELFEVSETPAHHLLKNWAAIQGRDLSPKKQSTESRRRTEILKRVYAELEAFFEGKEFSFDVEKENEELDELEKLVADNMIQDETQLALDEAPSLSSGNSPTKEPPNKRARMTDLQSEEEHKIFSEKENLQPSSSSNMIHDEIQLALDEVPSLSSGNSPMKEPPDKRARMTDLQSEEEQKIFSEKDDLQPSSSSNLTVPTQSTRCTSPDIFADSDEEPELGTTASCSAPEEVQNFSLKVYKDISNTDLNTYEIYSSDEVKTLSDTIAVEHSTAAQVKDAFIDLTQEQDTGQAEVAINTNKNQTLAEQDIFRLSPNIEFDQSIDALDNSFAQDNDQQPHNCTVSNELYAKYAYQTIHPQENLNLSASQPKSFLNLSSTSCNKSVTSTSLSSWEKSLSLSQFDNTKGAFQEHSFKSPLSRKSNSFVDKSAQLSVTPLSQSDASIDLTQDSADDEDDDEGAMLSDDEINYSIWKADKTWQRVEQPRENNSMQHTPLDRKNSVPFFDTEQDLDDYLNSSPAASVKSCHSRSPNKSALSKQRAQFGILDAAYSQSFTLSQPESQVHIDWAEASFLETPPEVAVKRYSSSCSHKFKELLGSISKPSAKPENNSSEDEIDEFDRLVFQNEDSSLTTSLDTMPSGLDRLLMGEINMEHLQQPGSSVKLAESPPKADAVADADSEQVEVNGLIFNVRVCHTPKPDFLHLTDEELLQHLDKYGLKQLERKQAVKLLEFIYNQTHPIMLPPEEPALPSLPLPRSKSTPVCSHRSKPKAPLLHTASTDCLTPTDQNSKPSYKFRDASGSELLRFSQTVSPALCDDFECFVLQTNVSKKTPQPLLPLHIAWHNLLCANPGLHESVLMYVPIDLQEIYMYFKQLGHRYDPKELKCFFDRRCIVFRYELTPPEKQVQRHVRKKKQKQPSTKF